MRALLVVNEHASTTAATRTPLITRQLAAAMDLTTVLTEGPGHGQDLAHEAATGGVDLVVVWGGDGTVNEVANGLIRSGRDTALAPLPGGHANVLARNLGLPRDAVAAAEAVAAAVQGDRFTRLGAGHITADGVDRWFLTNAGLGPDAAVLQRMSRRRRAERPATDAAYLRLAALELVGHWVGRPAALRLDPGGPAALALVVNLSPWTYLGSHALDPTPRAARDAALALYAPTSAGPVTLARLAAALLRSGDLGSLPGVLALADQAAVQVTTQRPVWLQADGEVLGQVRQVAFRHDPKGVRLVLAGC